MKDQCTILHLDRRFDHHTTLELPHLLQKSTDAYSIHFEQILNTPLDLAVGKNTYSYTYQAEPCSLHASQKPSVLLLHSVDSMMYILTTTRQVNEWKLPQILGFGVKLLCKKLMKWLIWFNVWLKGEIFQQAQRCLRPRRWPTHYHSVPQSRAFPKSQLWWCHIGNCTNKCHSSVTQVYKNF